MLTSPSSLRRLGAARRGQNESNEHASCRVEREIAAIAVLPSDVWRTRSRILRACSDLDLLINHRGLSGSCHILQRTKAALRVLKCKRRKRLNFRASIP